MRLRIPVIGLSILLAGSLAYTAASVFDKAAPGLELQFPKDHGKHSGFQTEWWYFTGNVTGADNHLFGFQLTFFRFALVKGERYKSGWMLADLYPAHFAITDITRGRFHYMELLSREGPDLASSSDTDLDVKVGAWTAKRVGDDTFHLAARDGSYALDLRLTAMKPVTLHGEKGYSLKSAKSNQASHYYSLTRLAAEGRLTLEGKTHEVKGAAWMDHEFGSSVLGQSQAGWDWFSLQLDDGTDLMVSYLRLKKKPERDRPFGTLVNPDGTAVNLTGTAMDVTHIASWTSPRTGAEYPSGWKLSIPDLDLNLEINPTLQDQELVTKESTGIAYWEGAVTVTGARAGKPVTGRGYVELTGYASSLGGLF